MNNAGDTWRTDAGGDRRGVSQRSVRPRALVSATGLGILASASAGAAELLRAVEGREYSSQASATAATTVTPTATAYAAGGAATLTKSATPVMAQLTR